MSSKSLGSKVDLMYLSCTVKAFQEQLVNSRPSLKELLSCSSPKKFEIFLYYLYYFSLSN